MGLGKTFLRSLIIVNGALAMTIYIVLIPRHSWRGCRRRHTHQ